jgi:alpha-glucosidase
MANKSLRISILLSFLLLGLNFSNVIKASNYDVLSPNKKLVMHIQQQTNGELTYSFTANGTLLIDKSQMGFKLESKEIVPGAGWIIKHISKKEVRSVWKPVWGKRAIVPDRYNELTIEMEHSSAALNKNNLATTPNKIDLIARAYDDGIAFQYKIPTDNKGEAKVLSEQTNYNFAGDYTAWFYNGENHNLGPEKLTATDTIRRPVMTIKAGKNHYMAVHEANLLTGEPLVLQSKKGEQLFTVASKPEMLSTGYTSAWRVILYGTTPGVLVDSHLIELLNPDPNPKYDFSWVKPGVAVWDWRINGAEWDGFKYTMSYPSWIRMIDFASEEGFKYLVLDANWYGPEFASASNPTEGDKAKEVQKLIAYGKNKGVGIWLYLNDVGGRKYPIEKTLKQYADWGAAGVKYGFMRGTQEEKNPWTQKITELCAKNHLLVDFHDGPVHPYGQLRTWPNAITREYCHAQLDGHHVFVPSTFVTTVYVNMVAGPVDMDNGMFDLRQGHTTRVDESQPVPSTLASEAARTLITFSGVTILPDIPEYYKKYPVLLDFLASQKMPWKESRTLAGEIGEYIVMMRQTDDAYLVGAATNESSREINLPLSFLGQGSYKAEIVEDGDLANYLTNRETIKISSKTVNNKESLHLKLAPGGGACLKFTKTKM